MIKQLQRKPIYLLLFSFLLLVSCLQNQLKLTADDSKQVEKYLDTKIMATSFGGSVFSANKIFTIEKDKIFLWAYLQEYYIKDGKTVLGSGWSVPLVLNVEKTQDGINIKSHDAPRDGDLYSEDIKRLFPKEVQQKIFDFPSTAEIYQLKEISLKRSKTLYL